MSTITTTTMAFVRSQQEGSNALSLVDWMLKISKINLRKT